MNDTSKKLLFVGMFGVGAFLALTSNLQFAIGVGLMVVGYSELRKASLTLESVKDLVRQALNTDD